MWGRRKTQGKLDYFCQQYDQGGTDIYGRPSTACCHRAFCPVGSSHKKLLPKSCFQSHLLLPGFKYVYIFPSSRSIYGAVKFQALGQRKTTTWWSSPISTQVLGHNGVLDTEARDWVLWRTQGQVAGGGKGTEMNWVPIMHPPCGGTLYTSLQSSLTPCKSIGISPTGRCSMRGSQRAWSRAPGWC